MAKHLSCDVFDKLKDIKTEHNYTLADAINSGLENPDSGIGIYAGDEQSYTLFDALFNPIIQEYHGFEAKDTHKSSLHVKEYEDLDESGEYILSTRVRVGRNLRGFALAPAISKEGRDAVEHKIQQALKNLTCKGKYYPLYNMSEEEKRYLIHNHFLFKEGDRFLAAAGANRDWPSGRGIYHNDEKTFLVWVNEEDQLRIISMQKGGDIAAVFARLVKHLGELERVLDFAYDERLGYITSCPTNLGTAMRASVHIRLPKLSQEKMQAICDTHHLQIRGKDGEHSSSKEGIYDISNKRRLGISEAECIDDLYFGVKALIECEKKLYM